VRDPAVDLWGWEKRREREKGGSVSLSSYLSSIIFNKQQDITQE
jgi:hypothetical protein